MFCVILQRTIGLRFLYPVYYIPEVEITPGKETSSGTIEKGRKKEIKKNKTSILKLKA